MSEHELQVAYAEPVVRTIEASGLDLDTFVVWGGSALAMHGLRSASDVDLVVEPDTFEELRRAGKTPSGIRLSPKRTGFIGARLIGPKDDDHLKLDLLTKFTATNRWFIENRNQSETIESEIGPINITPLDACRDSKLHSWRWRDRRDVKLIDRWVEEIPEQTA